MTNFVALIGRLTRDPELIYTSSGIAKTTFTLAVNRKYNKEETDFIRITAWRKLAEICANYTKKGLLVLVVGRLRIETLQDKNGNKFKISEVVAEEVRFLESSNKKTGSKGGNTDYNKKVTTNRWEDLGKFIDISEIDLDRQ